MNIIALLPSFTSPASNAPALNAPALNAPAPNARPTVANTSNFSLPSNQTLEAAIQGAVEQGRWARIKLLALDVDGVLTDGSLTFDENGSLLQTFYARDGFGLVAARRAGLTIAWISGRASRVAEKRFAELELHHCILACADKAQALRELQERYGFEREDCCFVGDDLPDLPAFSMCGLNVAVADSVAEVIARADYITKANGGRGAVREVVERILEAQNHWNELMSRFTDQEIARESTASESSVSEAKPIENLQR